VNQKISGYIVFAALAGWAGLNIESTDRPNAPADAPLSSPDIGGFLTGEHLGNLIKNALAYLGGHQPSGVRDIIPVDSKSLNVEAKILQNNDLMNPQLPQKLLPQAPRITDCLPVPRRIEKQEALVPRLDPQPSMSGKDDDNQEPRSRRGQLLDIYV
jgi:hypothetical protein